MIKCNSKLRDELRAFPEKGAVLLESGIALAIVLLISAATLDLFRFGYTILATEWILSRHARVMVLGGTESGEQRALKIREEIEKYGRKLGLELNSERNPDAIMEICAQDGACSEQGNAGDGSSMVVVRIRYKLKLLSGLADHLFQTVIFVRNEPF